MTGTQPILCLHCRTPLEPDQAFCTRCGAAAKLVPKGEDTLRDQVEAVFGTELVVEREIGRGAMGAVFAAFDPALQRRVAVKVLLPGAESNSIAERFIREARIAAALQHPNIVSVYGVRSRDDVRAIIMQYVEGRSLDHVIADAPRLPIPTVAKILADVAGALQHAHARGVVHRDVKPANVIIAHDGTALVTDFGIARKFDTTRITEEGLVVGTLPYISPEACEGGEAIAASDQYSLGIMAFELCVGDRPFHGSALELLHAHSNLAPPSLTLARPDIAAPIANAVLRMLEKDPHARWPSLNEIERLFRSLVVDAEAATREMAQLSRPIPRAGSTVLRAVTTRVATPAAAPVIAPVPATRVRPSATTSVMAEVRAPATAPLIPRASVEPRTLVTAKKRPVKLVAVSALGIVAIAAALVVWNSTRGGPAGTPAPPSTAQETAPVTGAGSAAATPNAPAQQPAGSANAARPSEPSREQAASPAAPRPDSIRPAVTPPSADSAAPRTTSRPLSEDPPRPPPRTEAAPAPARPAADIADARKLGNAFVTFVNKGQWRELESVPATGGDANARAALIRLVRGTRDVAAGFGRVPSLPTMTNDGFESEFIVDVEVPSGGRTQVTPFTIVISAKHDDAGWHLAGWRAVGAP